MEYTNSSFEISKVAELEFSDSEIVSVKTPIKHIIRGKSTGSYNYRAEIRKIDNELTEFIFGTVSNVDDYYVCILRCKLYIHPKEKVIFITDIYGFANNLWDPIEIYKFNIVENYWRVSQQNIDLFNLSLQRMWVGWDIRKYSEESMYIFELTQRIFNNVLYYPNDLQKIICNDIVEIIHNINHPKTSFSIKNEKWLYDEKKMLGFWTECDNSHSDFGTISIWFGFDKDYPIFNGDMIEI
jgi:hypothetical protein